MHKLFNLDFMDKNKAASPARNIVSYMRKRFHWGTYPDIGHRNPLWILSIPCSMSKCYDELSKIPNRMLKWKAFLALLILPQVRR